MSRRSIGEMKRKKKKQTEFERWLFAYLQMCLRELLDPLKKDLLK